MRNCFFCSFLAVLTTVVPLETWSLLFLLCVLWVKITLSEMVKPQPLVTDGYLEKWMRCWILVLMYDELNENISGHTCNILMTLLWSMFHNMFNVQLTLQREGKTTQYEAVLRHYICVSYAKVFMGVEFSKMLSSTGSKCTDGHENLNHVAVCLPNLYLN